uniref:Uncharacterized protein n=1 Tax=Anguilla anguilla TaxID=7936 RepID=A0A0E9WPJ2_ANGAN
MMFQNFPSMKLISLNQSGRTTDSVGFGVLFHPGLNVLLTGHLNLNMLLSAPTILFRIISLQIIFFSHHIG